MQQLLLLHGAIGAKDQLEPLAEKLRSAYSVHTISFSGHGGEPFNEKGFSIPVFAAEVLSYLHANKIRRVSIFGYSMGGYVAMYLARQQPAVVEKIITLATKYHWDAATAAREVKMLDAGTITAKVPAFATQLERRHAPNDWKLVLEKTREMLQGLGNQNALQPEDYKLIAAPGLLLLGDKDKMISAEETLAVQQALPHGEYRTLPGVPHPIEQVDMDMLSALVKGFI